MIFSLPYILKCSTPCIISPFFSFSLYFDRTFGCLIVRRVAPRRNFSYSIVSRISKFVIIIMLASGSLNQRLLSRINSNLSYPASCQSSNRQRTRKTLLAVIEDLRDYNVNEQTLASGGSLTGLRSKVPVSNDHKTRLVALRAKGLFCALGEP
jgi:hypothetical protein